MNNNFIGKNLIRDIKKGSEDAFRKFYHIIYPVVYRVVRRWIPVKEDCEDVLSNVLKIIWEQRKNLPEIRYLKSWLYAVCRHEAFRFLKEKKKYSTTVSIDDIPPELQISTVSADNELIESEMFELYHRAVNALPKRCQQIFRMVREEGLSYKQIAEMLSISDGTVEQQMHKAIAKMVEYLGKYYPINTIKALLRKKNIIPKNADK